MKSFPAFQTLHKFLLGVFEAFMLSRQQLSVLQTSQRRCRGKRNILESQKDPTNLVQSLDRQIYKI